MSRNHVSGSISGFGHFVNVAIALLAVGVIGAGYFSAIGQLAGVA
jgi:hypothetical protein